MCYAIADQLVKILTAMLTSVLSKSLTQNDYYIFLHNRRENGAFDLVQYITDMKFKNIIQFYLFKIVKTFLKSF